MSRRIRDDSDSDAVVNSSAAKRTANRRASSKTIIDSSEDEYAPTSGSRSTSRTPNPTGTAARRSSLQTASASADKATSTGPKKRTSSHYSPTTDLDAMEDALPSTTPKKSTLTGTSLNFDHIDVAFPDGGAVAVEGSAHDDSYHDALSVTVSSTTRGAADDFDLFADPVTVIPDDLLALTAKPLSRSNKNPASTSMTELPSQQSSLSDAIGGDTPRNARAMDDTDIVDLGGVSDHEDGKEVLQVQLRRKSVRPGKNVAENVQIASRTSAADTDIVDITETSAKPSSAVTLTVTPAAASKRAPAAQTSTDTNTTPMNNNSKKMDLRAYYSSSRGKDKQDAQNTSDTHDEDVVEAMQQKEKDVTVSGSAVAGTGDKLEADAIVAKNEPSVRGRVKTDADVVKTQNVKVDADITSSESLKSEKITTTEIPAEMAFKTPTIRRSSSILGFAVPKPKTMDTQVTPSPQHPVSRSSVKTAGTTSLTSRIGATDSISKFLYPSFIPT